MDVRILRCGRRSGYLFVLLLVGCQAVSQAPTPTLVATPRIVTLTPSAEPTARPSATVTPQPSPSPFPTATLQPTAAALAAFEPLANTAIIDRALRNVRALTDGSRPYKTAAWSPSSPWIAATPQDGPGLDVINSATGEILTVVTATFVLEPVWNATGAKRDPAANTLVLHSVAAGQDLITLAQLPAITPTETLVRSPEPLRTPSLAGTMLSYVQAGEVWLRETSAAAPIKLGLGDALMLALDPAGARLAWTPTVTNLEDVAIEITTLQAPYTSRSLTARGEGWWLPRWSPDGERLALTNVVGRVGTTTADGSARYDLGPGDGPAWSPDGLRLAFAGTSAGLEFTSRNLYIVDWRGQTPRLRLTNANEEQFFVSPSWSPDGKRLAFVEIDSGQLFVGDVP